MMCWLPKQTDHRPQILTSSALIWQSQRIHNSKISWPNLLIYFASKGGPVGRTLAVKHSIQTERPPVQLQLRRISEVLKSSVDVEVIRVLEEGAVKPRSSPWSSPNSDGKVEGWLLAVLCRLLKTHFHRPSWYLPSPKDRSHSWPRLWLLVGEVWRARQGKSSFFDSQGPFWIQGNAIWPYQCTCHVPVPNGMCSCWTNGETVPDISGRDCVISRIL